VPFVAAMLLLIGALMVWPVLALGLPKYVMG
jgi:hypothetical protein